MQTPTATRQPASRPPRARKPAPAQISPAAARLIEHIQAEAREQLLADLSAKDSIVVLHGFDAVTRRVRCDDEDLILSDDKGNRVYMWRRHVEPAHWTASPYMKNYWHPAYWYGEQTMVDGSGAKWTRDLPTCVCDDFGNLVSVTA